MGRGRRRSSATDARRSPLTAFVRLRPRCSSILLPQTAASQVAALSGPFAITFGVSSFTELHTEVMNRLQAPRSEGEDASRKPERRAEAAGGRRDPRLEP